MSANQESPYTSTTLSASLLSRGVSKKYHLGEQISPLGGFENRKKAETEGTKCHLSRAKGEIFLLPSSFFPLPSGYYLGWIG